MRRYSETIQSRLTDDQFRELIIYCKAENISVSKLIRQTLGEKVGRAEW